MNRQFEKSRKVVLMYYAATLFFMAAVTQGLAWYRRHDSASVGMGAMFFGVGAMWFAIGTAAKKKEARDNAA